MDLNQLAKRIVDEATGEVPITPSPEENKRLAKQKAANARANKLTEEQRKEIAKKLQRKHHTVARNLNKMKVILLLFQQKRPK